MVVQGNRHQRTRLGDEASRLCAVREDVCVHMISSCVRYLCHYFLLASTVLSERVIWGYWGSIHGVIWGYFVNRVNNWGNGVIFNRVN